MLLSTECPSFFARALLLLQAGNVVLLQQFTSHSAPPTLPDRLLHPLQVLCRCAAPALHCHHSPEHCNMTVSLRLLQVLSEKLDVLRLAFYTAPISCAVLLPLFFIREVGWPFPADDQLMVVVC